LNPVTVKVEITAVDLKSPSWSFSQTIPSFTLLPNQSTEISSIACPCPSLSEIEYELPVKTWTTSGTVVVCVIIRDLESGEVLSRRSDWPQPYRYLDMKEYARQAELQITVGEDGESVRIESKRPVKGLVLGLEGDEDDTVKWSDNGLDIIPGDVQVVKAQGLGGRRVTARYLGKEKL
jgi:beta-mannosidase